VPRRRDDGLAAVCRQAVRAPPVGAGSAQWRVVEDGIAINVRAVEAQDIHSPDMKDEEITLAKAALSRL